MSDGDRFARYLRAKRTVDDRSLDRRLVEALRDQLADRAAAADGPLRVLDAGAGVGTMLARMLEWDLLPAGTVEYTPVDANPSAVRQAPAVLREWAADRAFTVAGEGALTVTGRDRRVSVSPVVGDAAAVAEGAEAPFDLVVGVALLDILPVEAVDRLLGALVPGGLFYFPIVFDGVTRFRPPHPADRVVLDRYHDHMDWKDGGTSDAGDEVLDYLRDRAGTSLDGVAGSDWVVRPSEDGYPGDEAFLVQYVLDTVESALGELPGGPPTVLDEWLDVRREQVRTGDLVYLTHQLDFLGHVAEGR